MESIRKLQVIAGKILKEPEEEVKIKNDRGTILFTGNKLELQDKISEIEDKIDNLKDSIRHYKNDDLGRGREAQRELFFNQDLLKLIKLELKKYK